MPNNWSLKYFLLDYGMLALYAAMFLGWKLLKKTKYVKASEADLGLGESKNEIDAYEMMFVEKPLGKVEAFFLKTIPM